MEYIQSTYDYYHMKIIRTILYKSVKLARPCVLLSIINPLKIEEFISGIPLYALPAIHVDIKLYYNSPESNKGLIVNLLSLTL